MYAIKNGDEIVGYSDSIVYIRLHENGCYVPCPKEEAGGFCAKMAVARMDEELGMTISSLEDVVYALSDGALSGTEPVATAMAASGALLLAESDRVVNILLGGAED